MQRIQVIDSHTEGEPTRVIIAGGPELAVGDMAERRRLFRDEHDAIRSAVVCEPRGSDVVVGAILTPPVHPESVAGVIYFNNVGVLNMCVHGTIGVVATLAHLGRISPGELRLDTPVGTVGARLHEDGRVTVTNVVSYRYRHGVEIDVDGHGPLHGDIAWGGNWFFLVSDHHQRIAADNVERLTDFAWRIRQSLELHGVTGAEGGLIDHIELFAPPHRRDADSKNFVLCPGKAYDRSPCGTGTSAKLACLAADGKLQPGETWRQESVIGSLFSGTYESVDGGIRPSITGSAYITAESTLLIDPRDPFACGVTSEKGGGA